MAAARFLRQLRLSLRRPSGIRDGEDVELGAVEFGGNRRREFRQGFSVLDVDPCWGLCHGEFVLRREIR